MSTPTAFYIPLSSLDSASGSQLRGLRSAAAALTADVSSLKTSRTIAEAAIDVLQAADTTFNSAIDALEASQLVDDTEINAVEAGLASAVVVNNAQTSAINAAVLANSALATSVSAVGAGLASVVGVNNALQASVGNNRYIGEWNAPSQYADANWVTYMGLLFQAFGTPILGVFPNADTTWRQTINYRGLTNAEYQQFDDMYVAVVNIPYEVNTLQVNSSGQDGDTTLKLGTTAATSAVTVGSSATNNAVLNGTANNTLNVATLSATRAAGATVSVEGATSSNTANTIVKRGASGQVTLGSLTVTDGSNGLLLESSRSIASLGGGLTIKTFVQDITMSPAGALIYSKAPTASSHVVNKGYVDSALSSGGGTPDNIINTGVKRNDNGSFSATRVIADTLGSIISNTFPVTMECNAMQNIQAVSDGSTFVNGPLFLRNGGSLKLNSGNNSYSVTLAPPALTSNYSLTLPTTAGTTGQILNKTDSGSALSWITPWASAVANSIVKRNGTGGLEASHVITPKISDLSDGIYNAGVPIFRVNSAKLSCHVGHQSGSTIGLRNLTVGQEAGSSFYGADTGCVDNVLVGYRSGAYGQTGMKRCTGLGNYTLSNFPSVDWVDCTAIGYEAIGVGAATSCTAVGAYTNVNSGAVNSTAIGFQAACTQSNQIVLGNANVTQVKTSGALISPTISALEIADASLNLLVGTPTASNVASQIIKRDATGSASLTDLTASGKITCTTLQAGTGSNTAIGSDALLSATTASNSIAVGLNALRLATTGNFNNSIGVGAGQYITTGSGSVCIGLTSGPENGFGSSSNNVAIGTSAKTNGTTSCAIGYLASTAAFNNSCTLGYNSVCTANNQIMLGDANVTEVRTAGTVYTPALTLNGLLFPYQELDYTSNFTGGISGVQMRLIKTGKSVVFQMLTSPSGSFGVLSSFSNIAQVPVSFRPSNNFDGVAHGASSGGALMLRVTVFSSGTIAIYRADGANFGGNSGWSPFTLCWTQA